MQSAARIFGEITERLKGHREKKKKRWRVQKKELGLAANGSRLSMVSDLPWNGMRAQESWYKVWRLVRILNKDV